MTRVRANCSRYSKIDMAVKLSLRLDPSSDGDAALQRADQRRRQEGREAHHAQSLYFMRYNFVRIHLSLRCRPAMEAGVTGRRWSLEHVVRMLDDRDPAVRFARTDGRTPTRSGGARREERRQEQTKFGFPGAGLPIQVQLPRRASGCQVVTTKLVALAEAEQLTPGDGTNEGRSVHGPVRYVPCSAKYPSSAWAASSRSQNTRSSGSPRWHGPTGGGPMHATLSPDALKSQW